MSAPVWIVRESAVIPDSARAWALHDLCNAREAGSFIRVQRMHPANPPPLTDAQVLAAVAAARRFIDTEQWGKLLELSVLIECRQENGDMRGRDWAEFLIAEVCTGHDGRSTQQAIDAHAMTVVEHMKQAANAHDTYHAWLCMSVLNAPTDDLPAYVRDVIMGDGFANALSCSITLLALLARVRLGDQRVLSAAYVHGLAKQEDDDEAARCIATMSRFVDPTLPQPDDGLGTETSDLRPFFRFAGFTGTPDTSYFGTPHVAYYNAGGW